MPGKLRIAVGIDGCDAPAGKRLGDRGLPGTGHAGDQKPRSSVSIVGQP
jgi:hypothetical protein